MSREENELSEDVLKQIEYEQICEDWRHRDSMLWQSLAVSITLTGIIFGGAFSKDMSWMLRSIPFSMAFMLNCILLLKISKDHYYQLGSSELLSKLGSGKLISKIKLGTDTHVCMRMCKPSGPFIKELENHKNIPCPTSLYKWLGNISAFKCFFATQLFLILITFVSLCVSVYCWYRGC